jgi:hypothetical protein
MAIIKLHTGNMLGGGVTETRIGMPIFDHENFALWIDKGDGQVPVLDVSRQVELDVAQDILGQKSIATDLLKITGGGNGNILSVTGAAEYGNLEWTANVVSDEEAAEIKQLSAEIASLRRRIERKAR